MKYYLGCETVNLESWYEAIHPEDRPRLRLFTESVSGQAADRIVSDEFRVRRHDGDYRWFQVQMALLLERTSPCWIGAATDVDELIRAQRTLAETNQRKDEFLATLAHELRNPLAPVRFALEGLKADAPRSGVAHVRDVIERQVTQLVRLIEDLLDISRITTNKIQLRREPVRLADLMETAIESIAALACAADHQLDVELAPPTVWIDVNQHRARRLRHDSPENSRIGCFEGACFCSVFRFKENCASDCAPTPSKSRETLSLTVKTPVYSISWQVIIAEILRCLSGGVNMRLVKSLSSMLDRPVRHPL